MNKKLKKIAVSGILLSSIFSLSACSWFKSDDKKDDDQVSFEKSNDKKDDDSKKDTDKDESNKDKDTNSKEKTNDDIQEDDKEQVRRVLEIARENRVSLPERVQRNSIAVNSILNNLPETNNYNQAEIVNAIREEVNRIASVISKHEDRDDSVSVAITSPEVTQNKPVIPVIPANTDNSHNVLPVTPTLVQLDHTETTTSQPAVSETPVIPAVPVVPTETVVPTIPTVPVTPVVPVVPVTPTKPANSLEKTEEHPEKELEKKKESIPWTELEDTAFKEIFFTKTVNIPLPEDVVKYTHDLAVNTQKVDPGHEGKRLETYSVKINSKGERFDETLVGSKDIESPVANVIWKGTDIKLVPDQSTNKPTNEAPTEKQPVVVPKESEITQPVVEEVKPATPVEAKPLPTPDLKSNSNSSSKPTNEANSNHIATPTTPKETTKAE